jgi:hypothetical protein
MTKDIEELEDVIGLSNLLNKSLRHGSITCSMQINVKTHKSPIGYRPIHAATSFGYEGLSRWVAMALTIELKPCHHLLRDSMDLKTQLEGRVFPYLTMYRLDVKDFFLSGTPEILAEAATRYIEPQTKRIMVRRALVFLLERQLVTVPSGNDEVTTLKVKYGTGMGMQHSSETADLALYNLMERSVLRNQSLLQLNGIMGYFRFRDDILILGSNRPGARAFVQYLKNYSGCYQLEVEQVSQKVVQMLDLRLTNNKGTISTSVAIKPTAMGMPLSSESIHPLSVHESWTRAYVHRIIRLTSNKDDALRMIDSFIKRLRDHFHSDSILDMLTQCREDYKNGIQLNNRKREQVQESDKARDWLPMPYHPGFSKYLTSRLQVANNISARTLWGLGHADMASPPLFPCTNFAWKSDAPTVLNWIKK